MAPRCVNPQYLRLHSSCWYTDPVGYVNVCTGIHMLWIAAVADLKYLVCRVADFGSRCPQLSLRQTNRCAGSFLCWSWDPMVSPVSGLDALISWSLRWPICRSLDLFRIQSSLAPAWYQLLSLLLASPACDLLATAFWYSYSRNRH